MKSSLLLSGQKYVSSTEAADLTGYTKDYVGQLCREGRVKSKKFGHTWFVDEKDLLAYQHKKAAKTEKVVSKRGVANYYPGYEGGRVKQSINYESDDQPLFPLISNKRFGILKEPIKKIEETTALIVPKLVTNPSPLPPGSTGHLLAKFFLLGVSVIALVLSSTLLFGLGSMLTRAVSNLSQNIYSDTKIVFKQSRKFIGVNFREQLIATVDKSGSFNLNFIGLSLIDTQNQITKFYLGYQETVDGATSDVGKFFSSIYHRDLAFTEDNSDKIFILTNGLGQMVGVGIIDLGFNIRQELVYTPEVIAYYRVGLDEFMTGFYTAAVSIWPKAMNHSATFVYRSFQELINLTADQLLLAQDYTRVLGASVSSLADFPFILD